jgi:hypothetical protein
MMKAIPAANSFCALLLLLLSLPTTLPAEEETVVLHEEFEAPSALSDWGRQQGRVLKQDGRTVLRVENDDPSKSVTCRKTIPIERFPSRRINLSARLRAEMVSEPPNSWNGIKVMLVVETRTGKVDYPQLQLPVGTFDWATAERTLRLPPDTEQVTLTLGLERSTGKVFFDEVTLTSGFTAPEDVRMGDHFRGHALPRLRGVMLGPEFEEKNIEDLAKWNVNQIRWQLNWVPMKQAEEWAADLERYDQWLAGALENADQAIEACEKHNILVLLDLHCPPGGRSQGGVCRMLTEPHYQRKFLEIWEMIAKRYQGKEIIYAYDLINEPVKPSIQPEGLMTWPELATEATRIIRRIDPGKPIVFEPGPWGTCKGFDEMIPLDLDRVIYSFHMYQPHAFTHQFQMEDNDPAGIRYPGKIDGVMWDKERLRLAMQPALDFQKAYHVHLYVGEFSAIRWAPDNSAYRYLRDVIEIFEEEEWDWSYHAFREFHGWSMEHTTDRADLQPSETPTRREQLLRSWFEKNQRPER